MWGYPFFKRRYMSKKWLFFDVGSTLIDESECYNQRIRDAINGTDISFEQFNEKRIEFAKQNLKSDIEAIKYYNLVKTPWHKELEYPYPEAERVLEILGKRRYKIGIIANQSEGTAERLENWGLLKYIDIVISSAEEGIAKPDPEIFIRALNRAECKSDRAVMIGDRLDNDIYPAKKLGFSTIWVKQGFSSYQTPVNEAYIPDFTVEKLEDILNILK